jgi:chemotaxis protein MotB
LAAKKKSKVRQLDDNEEIEIFESWIYSYADMISLMFCLFCVLYGMSAANEKNYRALSEALAEALKTNGAVEFEVKNEKNPGETKYVQLNLAYAPQDATESTITEQATKAAKEAKAKNDDNKKASQGEDTGVGNGEKPGVGNGEKSGVSSNDGGEGSGASKKFVKDMKTMKESMTKALKAKNLEKHVNIQIEERGLVVSLITDKLIFDIGDADLKQVSKEILDAIVPTLNNFKKYPIRVEGHTCNLPIYTSRFRSNWELSTMRATNVAYYLIAKLLVEPSRIQIIGYGEYRPKFPNSSETNRAKNRRVDIVILNPEKQFTGDNNPLKDSKEPEIEDEPETTLPSNLKPVKGPRGFLKTFNQAPPKIEKANWLSK